MAAVLSLVLIAAILAVWGAYRQSGIVGIVEEWPTMLAFLFAPVNIGLVIAAIIGFNSPRWTARHYLGAMLVPVFTATFRHMIWAIPIAALLAIAMLFVGAGLRRLADRWPGSPAAA